MNIYLTLIFNHHQVKSKASSSTLFSNKHPSSQANNTLFSKEPAEALIIMIIITVGASNSNIILVQLPHANMKVDPRIMGYFRGKYSFSVNGRTLTITRIDADGGWPEGFKLRAYLQTENIPDFTSTVYTYWGLGDESAPDDTTEAIFHPSVTTIQQYAFPACEYLVWVTIPDTVTRIEGGAFYGCDSLKFIKFSRNLVYIGVQAFAMCISLEAVYLPPTINRFGNESF